MPTTPVLDSFIHHDEASALVDPGLTFVFLHGNPASSYIWRKVLPRVREVGRCLAPDLIGMGRSGKPAIAYAFDDHARYLEAWFDALALRHVVLVGIDWGGALAFDWATRHPARVQGVAFMETILRPMSWSDFPTAARPRFEAFRTPGVGERLVLEENQFLEGSLKATVLTPLADEDRSAYLAPYPTAASRLPLLQWPRAMPLEGSPADVVARIEAYDRWLAHSAQTPKLLLTFDGSPTLLVGPAMVQWCREHIASLEVRHCGAAGHLAPEDQPEAIAEAIATWARKVFLCSDSTPTSMRSPTPAPTACPDSLRATPTEQSPWKTPRPSKQTT